MGEYIVKGISLEEEYAKNPNINKNDIVQFRDWVSCQPHLPAKLITDLDLILFYHACKRSIEVAKQVLDINITLRTSYSNIFKDRLPDDKVNSAMHTTLFTFLPQRTKQGAKILFSGLVDGDPKKFVWTDVMRAFFMVIDLWQYEEGTWPGCALVVDLKKVAFGHLGRFDPVVVQQGMHFLQEALNVRLTEFYIINAPSFVDKILMLIRPFLKKEIQDMIRIHSNVEETFQYIPKEALPEESGGSYKSIVELTDNVWRKVQANEEFFRQESKKRVREELRPEGSKRSSGAVDGMQGNFKKLDFD